MTHAPILAFSRDFVNSRAKLMRIAGVERIVFYNRGGILLASGTLIASTGAYRAGSR